MKPPRLPAILVSLGLPLAAWAKDAAAGGSHEVRVRELQRSLFKTGLVTTPENVPDRPLRPVVRLAPPAPPQPRPILRETLSRLTLQRTSFTPYDRYLGSVRRVISSLDARDADMLLACNLMRKGRSFRYTSGDPYRAELPARTAARRAGDCKAKALWLYDQLGDPEALYVIGKLDRGSRSSHAWVYWRSQDRWWILDPTDRVAPIAADSVAPHRYVPYYSFGRSGTFRHPATSLLVQTTATDEAAPAVAASRSRSTGRRNDERLAGR